jgi:ubiquinone/menaquinone biosynthesis C-methylase UbiE
MIQMTHTTNSVPETTGRAIHWAGRYDLFIRLFLLGQERALREATVAMAGVKPGDKVLDVGCGTGSLALAAKRRVGTAGQVQGIDAAPEMIEVAARKSAQAHAEVVFQVGLIERIPFPDNSFDVVLCSLMLHHLPDDLKQRAFVEIYRVLKPGGHFFAVDFDPSSRSPIHRLATHLVGHGMIEKGMDDLIPKMLAARLSQTEAGKIKFGMLGFVRGSKVE